jgi:DNA repair protein RecO (recombination protein O)
MLKKTAGIVISYIKYRETSIIVRIFTRELGLKSYIVNSVRSAKAKSKIALYQPLSLLDLVVYDKENASLNRISEVKLSYAFQRIPFDFYRSGVAMFIGEVVGKAILDGEALHLSVYPHLFLLQLSQFLGFSPADAAEFYEQLQHGVGSIPISQEERHCLDQLLETDFKSSAKIPGSIRRKLMDHLLLHYKLHLDTFSEVKSVKVLMQMMQ